MPAPNHPKNARVRVCTTENGTYTLVGYVKSGELNRGSEGAKKLKWLGGESTQAGDRTLEGTLPIFWTDDDTTGQDILSAAWASGDQVWIQYCPKGTATGAKVFQFAAIINTAPITFDATGDAVEGTFAFTGDPSTLTTVTLS